MCDKTLRAILVLTAGCGACLVDDDLRELLGCLSEGRQSGPLMSLLSVREPEDLASSSWAISSPV